MSQKGRSREIREGRKREIEGGREVMGLKPRPSCISWGREPSESNVERLLLYAARDIRLRGRWDSKEMEFEERFKERREGRRVEEVESIVVIREEERSRVFKRERREAVSNDWKVRITGSSSVHFAGDVDVDVDVVAAAATADPPRAPPPATIVIFLNFPSNSSKLFTSTLPSTFPTSSSSSLYGSSSNRTLWFRELMFREVVVGSLLARRFTDFDGDWLSSFFSSATAFTPPVFVA